MDRFNRAAPASIGSARWKCTGGPPSSAPENRPAGMAAIPITDLGREHLGTADDDWT